MIFVSKIKAYIQIALIYPLRFLPGSSCYFGPLRNQPISIFNYYQSFKKDLNFFKEIFPQRFFKRKRRAVSLNKINNFLFDLPILSQTNAYLVNLPRARVIGPTVGVITKDDRLLKDVSLDWGRPSNHHFAMRRFSLPKIKYFNDEALLLASTGADTFYHWLIDSLPRIFLWHKVFSLKLPSYIIVNDDSKIFVREFMNILNIPQAKLISLKKHPHICCKSLWVPSLPCLGSSGNPPPWVNKFYKSKFKKETHLISQNKLFIVRNRKNSRYFQISQKVFDFLKSKGFIFIDLEKIPVRKQIMLFQRASFIVGVHGAGLANLIFANKCTVIEIFQDSYVNPCYFALSQLNDIRYFYLILNKNKILKVEDFSRFKFF